MNGAYPLDDIPRPGVAITLARWLELIAAEQERNDLRAYVTVLEEVVDPAGLRMAQAKIKR